MTLSAKSLAVRHQAAQVVRHFQAKGPSLVVEYKKALEAYKLGDPEPITKLIKIVQEIVIPGGPGNKPPSWFHALGTVKRNALVNLYKGGFQVLNGLDAKGPGVKDPEAWRRYMVGHIEAWGKHLRTLEIATQVDESDVEFQHGPFTVVPMPGVTKALLKGALEALDTAIDKLRPKFPNVLYGKVYLTTTLAKNVAAWYVYNEDKFYLNVKAKKRFNDIYTIIHELGHRHEHKFASAEGKRKFWTLSTRKVYEEIVFDDTLREQVAAEGTALAKARGMGKEGLKMSPELVAYLRHQDAPDAKKLTTQFAHYQITEKQLFEGLKGHKTFTTKTDRILHGPLAVTPYGATKPSENYAESFAHFVLGMDQPAELLEIVVSEAK